MLNFLCQQYTPQNDLIGGPTCEVDSDKVGYEFGEGRFFGAYDQTVDIKLGFGLGLEVMYRDIVGVSWNVYLEAALKGTIGLLVDESNCADSYKVEFSGDAKKNQGGRIGTYVLDRGSSFRGRPVYRLGDDVMYAHSDNQWWIGSSDHARGVESKLQDAHCPSDAKWGRYWDGNKWHDADIMVTEVKCCDSFKLVSKGDAHDEWGDLKDGIFKVDKKITYGGKPVYKSEKPKNKMYYDSGEGNWNVAKELGSWAFKSKIGEQAACPLEATWGDYYDEGAKSGDISVTCLATSDEESVALSAKGPVARNDTVYALAEAPSMAAMRMDNGDLLTIKGELSVRLIITVQGSAHLPNLPNAAGWLNWAKGMCSGSNARLGPTHRNFQDFKDEETTNHPAKKGAKFEVFKEYMLGDWDLIKCTTDTGTCCTDVDWMSEEFGLKDCKRIKKQKSTTLLLRDSM